MWEWFSSYVHPGEYWCLCMPNFFLQYVTEHAFESLIYQFEKTDRSVDIQLSYEERNALQYTAGYVTRALIKELKSSTHSLKEEMVCCLLDMNEANELDTPHESEDWTTIMNSGGLTHIRNMTLVCLNRWN